MSSNYKNVKPGDPGSIYYRCTYMKKHADSDWYLKKFGTDHSGMSKRKQKTGKGQYSDKRVNIVNCPQLYWKEEEIDEHIKRYLKHLAFDKTVIQKIKAKIGVEFKERMSAVELQTKGIELELKQKEKLRNGLIDKSALAESTGVAIEWQNRLKEVKAEMEILKAQLKTIDELSENDVDEVIDALSLCADLWEQFDKLDPMGKRRVVMSAFQEIKLKKGWFGDKKKPLKEKLFYAKWTESFHELWQKWFKGYLKKERDDREELGLDEIEEEMHRLDMLEGESDIDPKDAEEEPEEDLNKSMDSMWRAGRAWCISWREM